jgi:3-phenylpropionate/trans-cinnamate dioxygenase ferredoxin subunit
MSGDWHPVCAAGEIDEEDVRRFDHGGRTYAVYNTAKGFYATDGHCTHEKAHLARGLVIGDIIECPLHQGRFDVTTGRALSAPVCVNLATYPVKLEEGAVWVEI